MKTTHFALLLALLVPAAACSGGATNVSTSTAQTAATKAPLNVQVDGPLRTIADAFAEVPLRPDQRADIESMMTAAQARHQTLKPAAKDAILLLADQIEKGTIDEAALQPRVDAAVAAFKPVQTEDRKAIQRAHDLLDASQRAALTDALEAKRGERFGKHHGMHGGRHDLGGIAEELNLSADQKMKIFEAVRSEMKANRAEHHKLNPNEGEHAPFGEWKERHEKAVEAFKGDQFNIDRDVPAMDGDKGAKMMMDRGVRFAKVALPILTPEQRTTAAALLRERADKIAEMH